MSEVEKIYVIKNYDNKSLGILSDDLQKSRSTIYSFYKRWLERQSILNKKQGGSQNYP